MPRAETGASRESVSSLAQGWQALLLLAGSQPGLCFMLSCASSVTVASRLGSTPGEGWRRNSSCPVAGGVGELPRDSASPGAPGCSPGASQMPVRAGLGAVSGLGEPPGALGSPAAGSTPVSMTSLPVPSPPYHRGAQGGEAFVGCGSGPG